MEPKIISQTPITMAELKEEVARIKQREKEPSIRITRIEDYLNSSVEITQEEGRELRAALNKLNINRLKDEHVCKIVDLLPKTQNELKMITQGYALSLTAEASNKITEKINEFLTKK